MNEKMAYRKLKLFSSLNTEKALSEWSTTNCYTILKEICYTLCMFIKRNPKNLSQKNLLSIYVEETLLGAREYFQKS